MALLCCAACSSNTPANDAADGGVVDSTPADLGPAPAAPWPEWVFHHWVWEDESTQQSATALVEGYRQRDIPVGAIIIDSPWETAYNTFDWDTTLFAEPQKMIDDFHSKGVRVLLWIVPAINIDALPLYTEAKDKNYFMHSNSGEAAVVKWWKGDGSLLDYFQPAAVSWWHGMMDKALAYGIDGWKCDGLDFSAWLAPVSPGKGGARVTRIEYSTAYYRDFFEYTRSKLGNDRVISARPVDTYGADVGRINPKAVPEAAFAPREINWAGWVGDQDATFAGLKAALLNMYYSAQLGYVIFGSDIGGYRNDQKTYPTKGRSKELLIRWAQLGALCPLMENGGSGEHRPWQFDEETTDIYRRFVKLHYALIPYLNEHAARAFAKGTSLMTFTAKPDYAYLLGPDIFVAPMTESGTSKDVTFPEGRWLYLFDKTKAYDGKTTAKLDVPLGEFPVFVREGSSIAKDLSVP